MIFSVTALEQVYKDWQKEHPEWKGDFTGWMVMQYNEVVTVFDHYQKKQRHMDIEAVAKTVRDRKKHMRKTCIFCNEVTTVMNPDVEAHRSGCLFSDARFIIERAKFYETDKSSWGK
jgi:hypothetical protein